MDFYEGTRRGRRRESILAGLVLVVGLTLYFMPTGYQRAIRHAVRGSVLRPFVSAQAAVVAREGRTIDVDHLRTERDSLAALVAAQATLAEENRRLRSLLGLRARAAADFVPAEKIRVGVAGAESTFLLDVGRGQGVLVGSPVVAAGGLVGVVWEVDDRTSQAIDWTHPDFRVSAMTADGEAYGIVEVRRGRFREEDLLALTGAPFHTDIQPGTRIVTSGRGGIFPRGIPIGIVVGIEEADTGWRKSYLLRPSVRSEAVTHVLVGVQHDGTRAVDLSQVWHVGAPPDPATVDSAGRPRLPAADSVPPATTDTARAGAGPALP